MQVSSNLQPSDVTTENTHFFKKKKEAQHIFVFRKEDQGFLRFRLHLEIFYSFTSCNFKGASDHSQFSKILALLKAMKVSDWLLQNFDQKESE